MNMKFRAFLLLSLCHIFISLCACVRVWAFVLMCYKCKGGFCVHIICLCCLVCCIGIPAFVCACLCKTIRMHAKAFFLFTASYSSHLCIYFSQRVLCSELPKDLFTQRLTDSCLSRFIVPYRLWRNKNLQLVPLKNSLWQ